MSDQVVIHSVAGEAMKPGSQCRNGASVGVLGRQPIICEERRCTQKTAYSRTKHDRSNSNEPTTTRPKLFISSLRPHAQSLKRYRGRITHPGQSHFCPYRYTQSIAATRGLNDLQGGWCPHP